MTPAELAAFFLFLAVLVFISAVIRLIVLLAQVFLPLLLLALALFVLKRVFGF